MTLKDIPQTNAGFDIIAAAITHETSERTEATVVGRKKTEHGTEYVCWIFIYDEASHLGDFMWGFYTIDRKAVFGKMDERMQPWI